MTETKEWTLADIIKRRDKDRAACDAAWEASERAWEALQDLNARVAKGTELASAPGGGHLKPLLRERKAERDDAKAAHTAALARWKTMEEIYQFSASQAREAGAPEEQAR